MAEKTAKATAAKAAAPAKARQESARPAAAPRTAAKARDIGIDVPAPQGPCDDSDCPFHGTLPVRGQVIEGTVVSDRMNKAVIVKREYMRFMPKYERYEKRTSKYSAHNPPCISAKAGDEVTIAECRPLSKTVSFVVIGRKGK